MTKHSAYTSGYMIEVMDGSTHSETVFVPTFYGVCQWFKGETTNGNLETKVANELWAKTEGQPDSEFWTVGAITTEFIVKVGKDAAGFGVTYCLTSL